MAGRPEIVADLGKDSTGEPVSDVQDYLERFGYLGAVAEKAEAFGAAPFPMPEGDDLPTLTDRPASVTRGTFDDSTAEGLRRFQEFAGLPVTGVVDDAT